MFSILKKCVKVNLFYVLLVIVRGVLDFYEVLMCKSIPIVESWHHTYITREEATIKYKYLLYTNIENDIIYDDYVNENTRLFEKYHMLNSI